MAVLVAACSPAIEETPQARATPTPAPVATPHPARGATEAAIKLYPDLGKEGSAFHRAFMERYEHQKISQPRSLTQLEWPLEIAHRTASMLGVEPQPASTPPPPPIPATPRVVYIAPPRPPAPESPLSRGAYDQKRGVARPPIIVDGNGYRVR